MSANIQSGSLDRRAFVAGAGIASMAAAASCLQGTANEAIADEAAEASQASAPIEPVEAPAA